MAGLEVKSLNKPDETRPFVAKGKAEVVKVASSTSNTTRRRRRIASSHCPVRSADAPNACMHFASLQRRRDA